MGTTKKEYPRVEKRKFSELRSLVSLRTVNPTEAHWLRVSLRQYGLLALPTVNNRTGHLLSSALVIEALRELGTDEKSIECWVVDIDPTLEDAAAMALNNHVADWDWERVSRRLQQMNQERLNIAATGFHSYDIGPLLAADWKKPKVSIAESAEHHADQGVLL